MAGWVEYPLISTSSAVSTSATAWRYWADSSTSSSTTVWQRWTGAETTPTTGATDGVWYVWAGDPVTLMPDEIHPLYQQSQQVIPTAEELAAVQARLAAQQAEQQAKAAAEAQRLKAAQDRAERTLCAHLTPEQERAWREEQAFFVTSQSGRRFKVRRGFSHNLYEVAQDGTLLRELCVHIDMRHGCPVADNLLAQLLGLKFDEERFLKKANVWDLQQNRKLIQRSS